MVIVAIIFISCFLILVVIGSFYLIFTLSLFLGAPYVSTPLPKVEKILKLANPKAGETLYDLGSGDGRIIIEAVKNYNLKAIGIEINPLLVYLSRRRIKKLGLQEKAKVYWGNFFRKDISKADIIITYLLQPTNNLLEKKFLSELKPGTKIVSLSFTFKKIPLIKSESNIRLYQIP